MNAAKLFLGAASGASLTHIGSSQLSVTHSWREIHDNVSRLAAALHRLGVRPGDRVMILSNSRLEVIDCVLAAMSIGAAAMPISPTMGRLAIHTVVRTMHPRCCILEGPPDPDSLGLLQALGCIMVSLGGGEDAAAVPYRDLLGSRADRDLSLQSFSDEQPALIIHSSGSSGVPKVVVMNHGDVLRFFEYHSLTWSQYSDDEGTLAATSPLIIGLPLYHLAGIALALQCIMSGRNGYMLHHFLPHAYLKLLEQSRCGYPLLTPSHYRSLLREPYLRVMDRSALRCCILGGEACPPTLMRQIEAAFGVPAVSAYSMTECLSGIGHDRRRIFARTTTLGSCGRQLFGELSLRNEDGSVNESFGELWVRNATVHRCYLDERMNEARLQDGWFRTGDLFHRDPDGNFFHCGRADEMFICNGKNIYPLEMELLLLEHAAVEAACAAPVTSARKAGPVPAIMVIASGQLDAAGVQAHFRENGAPHTIPQFVLFVEALPMLGPGKVDRRQAAARLQAAFDAQARTANCETA